MVSARRRQRVALAILIGSAAWFSSLGVYGVWPLAWLAPLPLLLLAPNLSPVTTAVAAFLTAFLGSLNLLTAYGAWPLPEILALLLGPAVHFTAVLLLWRYVARRSWPRAAALAYALILAGSEYLLSLVSPHGTAGSIAYSQAAVVPLLQIASVTGLWGISFLLAWVPAALAMAWRSRRNARTSRNVLLSVLNPLLAAILFGLVRLRGESPAPPIPVGLFAPNARAISSAPRGVTPGRTRSRAGGSRREPSWGSRDRYDRRRVLGGRGTGAAAFPLRFMDDRAVSRADATRATSISPVRPTLP